MRRSTLLKTCCLLVAALPWLLPAARADMELTDPSGRRILLKDDGTWRVLDLQAAEPSAAASAADAPKEPPKEQPMAELQLLRQVDFPFSCRFEFELTNTLPYEIRSLVPNFSAHRANGVLYATESVNLGPVKPGDKTRRSLRFPGIACADIARLQVVGGDRCEMGDLNQFSDAKGECLARLRVQAHPTVKFEK